MLENFLRRDGEKGRRSTLAESPPVSQGRAV